MSIIDKVGALLPWRKERHELARPGAESRALREPGGLAFRDDLDRWLQRLVDEHRGLRGFGSFASMPAVDMHENDDEVVVTAEVPGVSSDDLSLIISPEGLVVRGDAREEREDKRRDYRLVESRYGSFARTVPLPPGLDLDGAKARLKDGRLTVRFPKVNARAGMRRIPINQ